MLGIDLVHIPEFQKQLTLGGATFRHKAFRAEELGNNSLEHLAGVWAAKEAVLKASGLKAGSWTDIHVSYNTQGKPYATAGDRQYEVSIAHHGDYAVAVATESGSS
ncbi:MAG TPA: 4'-phosphopantetheinyl transferase superfamily protein [Candidatus Saccharimonadales bacterium]|nr:4'-phosphopantetheinyl transferase superfamily protein [Candidatus Saccharimonadales bacterium]